MCFLEDTTILKVNTTYERAGEKNPHIFTLYSNPCVYNPLPNNNNKKAMLDIFLLPSRCNTLFTLLC